MRAFFSSALVNNNFTTANGWKSIVNEYFNILLVVRTAGKDINYPSEDSLRHGGRQAGCRRGRNTSTTKAK